MAGTSTTRELDRESFRDWYRGVRQCTVELADPLEPEDCVVQSMPDVSPTRWHLAHTTWFFETFVLRQVRPEDPPFHPRYEYLFNSYYNAVGPQFPRPRRGLLSRPTVSEVLEYRAAIDEKLLAWTDGADSATFTRLHPVLALGLHHERQHQELLLTDIKHVFSCNPLHPGYRPVDPRSGDRPAAAPTWHAHDEGLRAVGAEAGGFAFDNEFPRHRELVPAFELADRPVTNGEFLEFLEEDGYRRPELWLSEGWDLVRREGWEAPLYWIRQDGEWWQFTLSGVEPLHLDEPVCHVSYFEADAYARRAGARLPTEGQWETAAAGLPVTGNFVESGALGPRPAPASPRAEGPRQMFGDVWEWTASSYAPYPGYAPGPGALGEYNGKFMCNQMVLRGGSCLSAADHLRPTYRNFFPPDARWQCTGIRLAR
jgi:ergothioneine biosynthesis protein EgtB